MDKGLRSGMLLVTGRTETRLRGIALAHVGLVPGLAVGLGVSEMIDLAVEVDPDDRIARAARFRRGLGRMLSGRRGRAHGRGALRRRPRRRWRCLRRLRG